jgi:hypothetical protein
MTDLMKYHRNMMKLINFSKKILKGESMTVRNEKVEKLTKKKAVDKEEKEELSLDELDQVSGAGNPFKNIPRVPTQPIDDDLRDKA